MSRQLDVATAVSFQYMLKKYITPGILEDSTTTKGSINMSQKIDGKAPQKKRMELQYKVRRAAEPQLHNGLLRRHNVRQHSCI